MTTKKTAKKAAAKRASKKPSNGKRRHFIQLDVSEDFAARVRAHLRDNGFADKRITISHVGRFIFQCILAGKPVKITNAASFLRAQAAFAEGGK